MAALIQNSIDKVNNELHPYLYNNRISPLWDLVEQKIQLERSILALGMLLSFFFAFCNVFFT
jgi:hypothetical protein